MAQTDQIRQEAVDRAGTGSGEDAGSADSDGLLSGPPAAAPFGLSSDVASDSDVGRIGGGGTGTVSTGSSGTSTAGTGIDSGGTGGAEPTDTGFGSGTGDIGTGVAGARRETGTLHLGGVDPVSLSGVGGAGVGETGTEKGSRIAPESGGTGDIGGMGGSSAGSSAYTGGGTGTDAVGGIGGGPGTSDEGTLGAADPSYGNRPVNDNMEDS